MTRRDAARALDASGDIVGAVRAYELALAEEPDATDLRLDLAALYVAANDPGAAAAHHLPKPFVDAAYGRCVAVLQEGLRRGGPHPELLAWRLHLKERVVGEPIPPGALEALARDERAEFARLLIYASSGRTLEQASAAATFRAASARRTERERCCMSYAPPARGFSSGAPA
ncbi:tetratricopeptide repeat protein [Longimicrobium terrae]|uniref:Tetratricopeptide repeat protein n=1 Tax=Longimicrobium terrae TaxID=1639882 RepID=A0A841GV01_9BACT|nr:tetratricopeptide repeat protein [Longimicrobium terrae]MBB4634026.1 hypothetical protein [Longimicrobium terrae]MBB6069084.1 hypothetical protein [Longimicrobium terrae]NNC28259.1 hypothetical protein [Longimicrobium terrae]